MERKAEWLLEAVCNQGFLSEAELYDELRRRGKDLLPRASRTTNFLSWNEELELFNVMYSMRSKFILCLPAEGAPYWVVYLKNAGPFLLRNATRSWYVHNNRDLFRGFKQGYELLNDVLTQYVAWRLSDLSSLQRFDAEEAFPQPDESPKPPKTSILRKFASETAEAPETTADDRSAVQQTPSLRERRNR